MLPFYILLLPLVLGQFFPSVQQNLQGISPAQMLEARQRFTQLSAGLSPEARMAEQEVISIARNPSLSPFETRTRVMQIMSTLSPSVGAELQSVRQQLMPAGFGGLMG